MSNYKPRRRFASRRAGLILIHRFPLSLLLFHNHRFLPVPIRGFLALHFCPLFFSPPFSLFPAPGVLPLLPLFLLLLLYMAITCPYCHIISSYTGFVDRDDAYGVMLQAYTSQRRAVTWTWHFRVKTVAGFHRSDIRRFELIRPEFKRTKPVYIE